MELLVVGLLDNDQFIDSGRGQVSIVSLTLKS